MCTTVTLVNSDPVVVIGAGGHALVAIEAIRSSGGEVRGCISSGGDATADVHSLGVPMIGVLADLPVLLKDDRAVFVAVGANRDRARLTQEATAVGAAIIAVVSCQSTVSPTAQVSPGGLVMPGVVLNALARIGKGAIVNTGALIDHECVIDDFAHVAPGAVLAGNVRVGQGALVGIGARILPGRRVGAWSVVGAGAVVIDDVPDGATVVGVPARIATPPDGHE